MDKHLMIQAVEIKEKRISSLKKRSDFLRVAGAQKKWITPGFIVQISKQPDDVDENLRVGFTASKKVGNAVKRSRAKRRLRETARQILETKGKNGHDYVLIARREVLNKPFKELIRDLKWSLKRLHDNNHKNGERGN